MPNLRVVGVASGLPLPTNLIERLCNADRHPPYRHCYAIVPEPSHPATVAIVNHAFVANLYRPARRERMAGWWVCHRWPLLRGAILFAGFLVMWVVLNLLLDGANALADWLVQR